MADLTFIDWDTRTILEDIKTQYKANTGSELIIGSSEFAIASVVAYILGVAKERFNAMAKQRYLSTANGEYLDAIAETLGIGSRPKDYKARCTVRFTNLANAPQGVQKGFRISDDAEHIFQLMYFINIDGNDYIDAMCESLTSDTDNNNIPVSAIKNLVDGDPAYLMVRNQSVTLGANPAPFPYTDEGDNLFREYIKATYQGVSAAGSFYTYRKLAIESDPRVKDAYVLKSGDTGFVTGSVKIFWSNAEIGGRVDDSAYYEKMNVNTYMREFIEESNLKALNDVIEQPSYADAARTTNCQYIIFFDNRKYSWEFISGIVEAAKDEYCDYIRNHMGQPFSCVEFFEYIRKQQNGECIDYIAPMSNSPDFINCHPWQVAVDKENIQLIDANAIPG